MSGPEATIERPDVDELPPAELQAAARVAYLEAAASGRPPTGAQLGEQFARSGRWGRDRIAEAKATTVTHASPHDPPTVPGTSPGAPSPAATSTATAPDAGGGAYLSSDDPRIGPGRPLGVAGPVVAGTAAAPGAGDVTDPSPGGPRRGGSDGDPAGTATVSRGTAIDSHPPAGQGPRTGGSHDARRFSPGTMAASERSGSGDRGPSAAVVKSGPVAAAGSDNPARDDRGTLPPIRQPTDGNRSASPAVRNSPNGSHAHASPVPSTSVAVTAGNGDRGGGSRSAAVATIASPSGNRTAAAHLRSTELGSGPATAPAAVRLTPIPAGEWSRRIIRWVTTVAVIVVAGCAARSSYEHQRTVVEMAGEHRSAWYMPLSVDGMMLIASLNMLVRRWDGQRAGWLTWTALLLGGAASLAANIAAAEPTLIGRVVAGWSPVCLIVSYELLMQQLPHRTPVTMSKTVPGQTSSQSSAPS